MRIARSELPSAPSASVAPRPQAIFPVTSCLDDGSAGTLRSVILAAASGDVVDLSALSCSTITLATDDILFTQHDLTINGPADGHLTIDAGTSTGGVLYSYSSSGTLTLQNLTLANSHVTTGYLLGGAVEAWANLVLNNMVFTNNSVTGDAPQGGAVFSFGTSTVSNSVFTGNSVHVTNGQYYGVAGALSAHSGVTITNSTFTGNTALADSGFQALGGAIFGVAPNTISNSTFSGNTATTHGGAIAVRNSLYSSTNILNNVTLSGNSSGSTGGGLFSQVPLQIFNSTIAFNHSVTGAGGIYLRAASELESTIVSNNTTGAATRDGNVGGTNAAVLSGNNNVIPTSGLTLPMGTIVIDPALQPLADNGGPDSAAHPKTHALLAGSSAIDAGNNLAGLATDARNHARVFGAAADAGAFELDDTIFRDGF